MTDNKKHTVVAFGEVLWDLLPDQSIIGGAPFNFAYRIHSLGANGLIISRVGRDKLGRMAFRKVRELGLSTEFIQKDEMNPTGRVEVCFDERMNPDYTITKNVAYDFIELTNSCMDLIGKASCICFGTLIQRNSVSRNTLYKLLDAFNGSIRYYDINLRKECFSSGMVESSLARAEIVKLNDSEAMEISGMFGFGASGPEGVGKALIDKFSLGVCLITLGEKGVLALSTTGETHYVPAYRIKLADPLGAGDAFSAGFIHAWLNHGSLYEACCFGNVLGAIAATQKGATVPIPRAEIDSFMKKHHERNIHKSFEQYITG